jgi:Protein of unknown function (DUF4058)
MPSPFPGMNPYLERDDIWLDFHQSFIPALRETLAEQVRPKYLVKLEEQLFIHELPENQRRFVGRADVSLAQPARAGGDAVAVETAAPAYGRLVEPVDIEPHTYIEIRDRHGLDLVTVIELLSPSNKQTGGDRDQYLAKPHKLLSSPTHLIEIDLLRSGPRLPLDGLPACDYCVTVSRAQERPRVGIWPIQLKDKLPIIPVPLRPPDADATVDLQAILHRVYDAAGYADYLYSTPPRPPLDAKSATWARQFVPAATG